MQYHLCFYTIQGDEALCKPQVRSERGVLPEDHPERVATRLGLAISAVEREDTSAATSILEAYMDDEEDRITKVCSSSPSGRHSTLINISVQLTICIL